MEASRGERNATGNPTRCTRQVSISLVPLLTNVHYGRLVRRLPELTCSGAVREAEREERGGGISRWMGSGTRKGGGEETTRLSEAHRAPAGLLIAITVNNLQRGNGCVAEQCLTLGSSLFCRPGGRIKPPSHWFFHTFYLDKILPTESWKLVSLRTTQRNIGIEFFFFHATRDHWW